MDGGVHNITIKQGADWFDEIELADEDGEPVDFTGYAVVMQIRDAADALVIELSTANGRITIAGRVMTRRLNDADTAALTPQRAVYDMFTTSPAGVVDCLLEGQAVISARITR